MTWLLWKEYRLQRLILVVGVFLMFLPYAVCLLGSFVPETINLAAVVSTILSIMTLALLGGNAIACERADRSAEFQAYQPISRLAILATKLLFPVLAAVVLWGVNLYIFERWQPHSYSELPGRDWMFKFCLFGFCAFSVAWLLSALQSSPTFAVGAAMASPVAILMLLAVVPWPLSWIGVRLSGQSFDSLWTIANIVVGLLSFAAGTWYFWRRIEP